MDDELQEMRDNFHVGNFTKVVGICESTNASNELAQGECDATLGRAYLSLQLMDKLKAMQNSQCPGQKAAALMAILMKSKNESQKTAAKDRLSTLTKETQDMSCAVLTACMLAHEGNFQDAVALTQQHPTIEMQALRVLFLLMCNQVDQAERKLKEMEGSNDDSAVFRLAQAAVNLGTGNSEEAYLICCDLSAQFPAVDGEDNGTGSVYLQTGKAVANMQRGMFAEAVEDLQRAHQMAPKDVDVLINLCCCMTNLGKKEDFQKYYAMVEQLAPEHPYVMKTQALKNNLARFKANLAA